MIEIINPGALSTVQDIGRVGYRDQGVPTSGWMDPSAAILANEWVGNSDSSSNIECFLGEFEFKVLKDIYFSVAGAYSQISINKQPVPIHHFYQLSQGDNIKIINRTSGQIAYVAFAGKLEIPIALDSFSTCLPGKFGGYDGRPLRKGDIVKIESTSMPPKQIERVSLPKYTKTQVLRFIPGPEFGQLSNPEQQKLFNTSFAIGTQSNRIGYRLEEVVLGKHALSIPSRPVFLGTMQLPPNGLPIILMADAQTTGGYPRIGQIVRADIGRLAQCKPGNRVRFRLSNH
ncbi:MAG: biotin-dependent carboxyltransferase family protein [Cyclobacteriaceae bacterium]